MLLARLILALKDANIMVTPSLNHLVGIQVSHFWPNNFCCNWLTNEPIKLTFCFTVYNCRSDDAALSNQLSQGSLNISRWVIFQKLSCDLTVRPYVCLYISVSTLSIYQTQNFSFYSRPFWQSETSIMVRNTHPHYVKDVSRQKENMSIDLATALASLEDASRLKFDVRMEELIFPEKIWLICETNLLSRFLTWGDDEGYIMINLDEFEDGLLANHDTTHLFKVGQNIQPPNPWFKVYGF